MLRLDTGSGNLPFSRDLVPIVGHPFVISRGPAVEYFLLAQKLLSWLWWTQRLEVDAVIPACSDLAFDRLPIMIPEMLQVDAERVIVDEAHHSYCGGDLIRQITSMTGVRTCRQREPRFLTKQQRDCFGVSPRIVSLQKLVFTIVAETLITSTLTRVPADKNVIDGVRDVVRDHAHDEARHHAVFSQVMNILWSQLSTPDRDVVGPYFANCIDLFLRQDLNIEKDWLMAAGFDEGGARRIVSDTYGDLNATIVAKDAAGPTIRLMTRFGITENLAAIDALGRCGFI